MAAQATIGSMFKTAEAKLDEAGRGAWIVIMILGFIVFWPLGLAILGYMIWSGRMGCKSRKRSIKSWARQATMSTGNTAFDEYRAETLRRLEEEREEFIKFLERLRQAKDRSEFDQFMRERNSGTGGGQASGGSGSDAPDSGPQPAPQPAT